MRNRIIAGISSAVVVVEAASEAGSLITARLADDFGRDVFAVPGSVLSEASVGCHELLRDGAILCRGAEDVLAEIFPAIGLPDRGEAPAEILSEEAGRVLDALRREEALAADDLADASILPAAGLLASLFELETRGRVKRFPGTSTRLFGSGPALDTGPMIAVGSWAGEGRDLAKSLVIVESPAKAKTLEKFLGKDFKVLASYGHVRDLPRKGLGVDREHAYAPSYELLAGKEKTINDLKKAAKSADNVYLAADPDREGEAISWHLQEALKPGADKGKFRRVRFNEITKKAVLAAMDDAGEIDERLVDAQQARRIIDRLVGYEVSDLLWKKIWRGLSAGRVQTVALRIICERENEIEAFVPVEYWAVDARLEGGAPPRSRRGCPPSTARSSSSTAPTRAFRTPRGRCGCARRSPARPGRSPRSNDPSGAKPAAPVHHLAAPAGRGAPPRVRRAADDADRPAALRGPRDPRARHGRSDHLHAHRLDARLAGRPDRRPRAHRRAVRRGVASRVPALLQEPPRHAGRPRGDPADVPRPAAGRGRQRRRRRGEALPPHLAALRGLADGARPSTTRRRPRSRPAAPLYRASGSTLKFPGYLAAYGISEEDEEETERSPKLPPLTKGETLSSSRSPEKKETAAAAPLQRGVAREVPRGKRHRPAVDVRRDPAQDRGAALRPPKDRRFIPTALGRTVIELLIPYFDDFFETSYTARMEEAARRGRRGQALLDEGAVGVRQDLHPGPQPRPTKMVSGKAGIPLAKARKLRKLSVVPEIDEKCPKCGKRLKLRMGKNGLFVACCGYPGCAYTYNIPDPEEDVVGRLGGRKPDLRGVRLADEAAPDAGARPFLGCTAYPKCRNGRHRGRRRQRRSGPDEPTGRSARDAATTWSAVTAASAPTSPAPTTRPASIKPAEADQRHGRRVPQGRRHDRRAARTVPAFLRLRELSELRFFIPLQAVSGGLSEMRARLSPRENHQTRGNIPVLRQSRM